MALLSGLSETKILEVRQTEIYGKARQSMKESGWLPNLFRSIVAKAKDFLQNLIREHNMQPKPVPDMDMSEFRHMQNLMVKAQDGAREIRRLQNGVLPNLKEQLAGIKGIFKAKERKALETQIRQTEQEISVKLDKLPDILKSDGYPDVQAFMATYQQAEFVVEQYNRELAEWERTVSEKRISAETSGRRPLEKESVKNRLRQLQEQGRQKSQLRQRTKSFDRDSR